MISSGLLFIGLLLSSGNTQADPVSKHVRHTHPAMAPHLVNNTYNKKAAELLAASVTLDNYTDPSLYASDNPARLHQVPVTLPYSYMVTNMPEPRLEWNENYGYCGSVAFITGLLKYGTYISQYDNRNLASNGTRQSGDDSQLLLGINDYWTASQHSLNNNLWQGSQTNFKSFISWMKGQVLNDAVVVMGVFENSYVFGQSPPDDDYDHIVPVVGWASNHPLTDTSYYADDVIYFTDNGLYTPSGDESIYSFSYPISTFGKSRSAADKSSAPTYSINSSPSRDDPDYAIALTGPIDDDGVLLPVSLDTSVNYESPEIEDGSNSRPRAMSLTLTITVNGLTAGTDYNLYQYTSLADVPTSKFNGNSDQASASSSFTATGSTYTTSVSWSSNKIAVYRCVAADAP